MLCLVSQINDYNELITAKHLTFTQEETDPLEMQLLSAIDDFDVIVIATQQCITTLCT